MGIKKNPTEEFLKTLEKAMKQAKDIPGIVDVRWKLAFTGPKSTVETLTTRVNDLMKEVNGTEEEPEKEEVVTSNVG